MNISASSVWPPPVDLYGLGLLRMVARHRSMTRAAAASGLTQSALTRQVQNIEQRLGLALFDRTTRWVRPTPAAEALLRDTASLQPMLDEALRRLGQEHLAAPREVRVGISRSIAFGHLPGLLHAHGRRAPNVRTIVEHLSSSDLFSKVEAGELDVGVLCPPIRLPATVLVTHRMHDTFQLVAPAAWEPPDTVKRGTMWPRKLIGWLQGQPWLLLSGPNADGHTNAPLAEGAQPGAGPSHGARQLRSYRAPHSARLGHQSGSSPGYRGVSSPSSSSPHPVA